MAFTFRAMPTAIGETVEDDLTTLIVAWAMPGLEIFEPASLRGPKWGPQFEPNPPQRIRILKARWLKWTG